MMSGFPTVHDSSLMDALGLVSADVPSTNHIREKKPLNLVLLLITK